MVAAAAAGAQTSHDYSKIYAGGAGSTLNKPSSLPASSSGGLDSTGLAGSTSFKHLESGKSFNYSVPAGVGGSQATGYYMQVHSLICMALQSAHVLLCVSLSYWLALISGCPVFSEVSPDFCGRPVFHTGQRSMIAQLSR